MVTFIFGDDEPGEAGASGSGPSTQDTSSPASPSMAPGKEKKAVGWLLPDDKPSPSLPEEGHGAQNHSHDPVEDDMRLDPQRSREHEEELRRGIHRIFSHDPHDPSSTLDPSRASRRQLQHDKSHARSSFARKSAMRSGGSTPIPLETPPNEMLDEGVTDVETKTRSAANARDEADKVSKSLYDPGDGSVNDLLLAKPKKKSRWRDLERKFYHDGKNRLPSGQVTPRNRNDGDFAPQPTKYRRGLATLTMMGLGGISPGLSRRNSMESQEGSSGPPTPRRNSVEGKLPDRGSRNSVTSLLGLIKAPMTSHERRFSSMSTELGSPDDGDSTRPDHERSPSEQHSSKAGSHLSRNSSSTNLLEGLGKMTQKAFGKSKDKAVDIAIKKHVRENKLRQTYLLKLCRALMEYGAPTHRLENYMRASSNVLQIEAQFLYLPGCMIVSFDDSMSHTAEVKIVRVSQGVNLGKLTDTHDIYKRVVHDELGVDAAIERLSVLIDQRPKFKLWLLILAHGFASATVGPFAFRARLIDLPPAFILGCLMGGLREWWATKSELYASIFEVSSVAITSFASRAFGSIRSPWGDGEYLFCFSALAQSSIALILPGYILLCGALELQSRSIVAGSVRMVYAIIYALFIGFGLTVGPAILGAMYKDASSETTCRNPMPPYWFFFFVPPFALCLMIINQAKWQHMPIMLVIAFAGYCTSYFAGKEFAGNAAVSSGLAAIVISVLANLYSRLGDSFYDPAMMWCNRLYSRVVTRWSRSRKSTKNDGIQMSDLENQNDPRSVNQREQTPFASASSSVTSLNTMTPGERPREPDSSGTQSQTRSIGSSQYVNASSGIGTPATEKPNNKDPDGNEIHTAYAIAAAAMLPAIFVLVPSGLSASGSLVAGLETANNIITNTTEPDAAIGGANGTASEQPLTQTVAFAVGYSVVQIAVGITVGLFVGTLISYPFGKGGKWGGRRTRGTRSGLFTM